MLSATFCLLLSVLSASAAPSRTPLARQINASTILQKVLIGGPTFVAAADFDGSTFNIVANNTIAKTSASWLLFKEPNILYAVDENSNTTRLFNFDPATNELTLVQNATGSSGVVFLELNQDKTRMVGAAFGQGQIDVWDVSAADGQMKLLKQVPAGGTLGPHAARQAGPHPHEALLDPTGRFFVIPDLGTDSILVLDSKNDTFEITNRVAVQPAGTGPRHGSFFPLGAKSATHFFLACEIMNVVQVFELTYTCNNLEFKNVQTLSTFGANFPPANMTSAAVGELVISADNKHLYISNRLTGNDTDSIAHFSIDVAVAATTDKQVLSFVDSISSGGLLPRMFSLAADDSVMFSSNQDGANALVAFKRDNITGSLTETPIASLPLPTFGAAGFGPQFIMEIGAKGSTS